MRKNRIVAGMLVALMTIGCLAGCQSGGAGQTPSSAPASSKTAESTSVGDEVPENILVKAFEATKGSILLQQYDAIRRNTKIFHSEDTMKMSLYEDKDKVVLERKDFDSETVVLKQTPVALEDTPEDREFHYFLPDAHIEFLNRPTYNFCSFTFSDDEKITSTEVKDDKYIVNTEIKTSQAVEGAKSYAETLGYDTEGIQGQTYIYEIDKASFRLLKAENYIKYEKESICGEEHTFEYGVSKVATSEVLEEALKAKPINLQFRDVSDKTKAYDAQTYPGFRIHIASTYEQAAYKDEACTTTYDGQFVDGDVIYIKQK